MDPVKNPFPSLIPFRESGSKRHKLIFSIAAASSFFFFSNAESRNKDVLLGRGFAISADNCLELVLHVTKYYL